MKYAVFILFSLILLNACGGNQSEDTSSFNDAVALEARIPETEMMNESPPPPPLPGEVTVQTVEKRIIKDGRMGMEVVNLEAAKRQTDSLNKQYDAYYANERLQNNDREITYYLTVRIPSEKFESFTEALEGSNGEITYKEIHARDVTEQFIDLETRLANKRNYLEKYNDLLKKAASVKEILEIEDKIRVIEEEIESTTGRLKYLSDQVAFSTLELEIRQPKDYKYAPVKRDGFGKRLGLALSKGWYGFVDFVVVLFYLWPFWLLGAFTLFAILKIRKRRRNQKDKTSNR